MAYKRRKSVPRAAKIPDKALQRLARYWFRAKLMHDLLHTLFEEYDDDLDKLLDAGHWWEFDTYLSHWLSGLFVVVEGFNKLKLRDARVQGLFKEHMKHLKAMRHETYPFILESDSALDMLWHQNLNWAEELHEVIGDYLKEHVTRKIHVERLLELRAKKRGASE
jgi:hypothetical protein